MQYSVSCLALSSKQGLVSALNAMVTFNKPINNEVHTHYLRNIAIRQLPLKNAEFKYTMLIIHAPHPKLHNSTNTNEIII